MYNGKKTIQISNQGRKSRREEVIKRSIGLNRVIEVGNTITGRLRSGAGCRK